MLYSIQSYIEKGYNFDEIFPDRQQAVREATGMKFTLNEISLMLQRITNNFQIDNPIAQDLDKALTFLVKKWDASKQPEPEEQEPEPAPMPAPTPEPTPKQEPAPAPSPIPESTPEPDEQSPEERKKELEEAIEGMKYLVEINEGEDKIQAMEALDGLQYLYEIEFGA